MMKLQLSLYYLAWWIFAGALVGMVGISGTHYLWSWGSMILPHSSWALAGITAGIGAVVGLIVGTIFIIRQNILNHQNPEVVDESTHDAVYFLNNKIFNNFLFLLIYGSVLGGIAFLWSFVLYSFNTTTIQAGINWHEFVHYFMPTLICCTVLCLIMTASKYLFVGNLSTQKSLLEEVLNKKTTEKNQETFSKYLKTLWVAFEEVDAATIKQTTWTQPKLNQANKSSVNAKTTKNRRTLKLSERMVNMGFGTKIVGRLFQFVVAPMLIGAAIGGTLIIANHVLAANIASITFPSFMGINSDWLLILGSIGICILVGLLYNATDYINNRDVGTRNRTLLAFGLNLDTLGNTLRSLPKNLGYLVVTFIMCAAVTAGYACIWFNLPGHTIAALSWGSILSQLSIFCTIITLGIFAFWNFFKPSDQYQDSFNALLQQELIKIQTKPTVKAEGRNATQSSSLSQDHQDPPVARNATNSNDATGSDGDLTSAVNDQRTATPSPSSDDS